jgi:hypothetical protein
VLLCRQRPLQLWENDDSKLADQVSMEAEEGKGADHGGGRARAQGGPEGAPHSQANV